MHRGRWTQRSTITCPWMEQAMGPGQPLLLKFATPIMLCVCTQSRYILLNGNNALLEILPNSLYLSREGRWIVPENRIRRDGRNHPYTYEWRYSARI
ncbi:hypothetical protein VTN96DRAFT_1988 [Rasamsonia emersonii]